MDIRIVQNSIVNSLRSEDFAAIRPWLVERYFHRKAILQDRRRRIQNVSFIESGILSVRRVSSDSSIEVALADFRGAVGTSSLLGEGQAGYQLVAITHGVLLSIPNNTLLELVNRRPILKERLLRSVHASWISASQIALCGMRHQLKERRAGWFCRASEAVGEAEIPVTQGYLATILGLRRPSVTEALIRLEEEGLIERTRGAIRVRNRELLELKACRCYSVELD
jgi:CRP-like cAMP-binding protein